MSINYKVVIPEWGARLDFPDSLPPEGVADSPTEKV